MYGRTQFRLRPDAREATFLRSKLVCNMHNRIGLPSISTNYATLYINDEYLLSIVHKSYREQNPSCYLLCRLQLSRLNISMFTLSLLSTNL